MGGLLQILLRFAAVFNVTLILMSCDGGRRPGMRHEQVYLQDSLFVIDLDVPIELDSFTTWVDQGDNSCDQRRKYRFQDARYPVINESGFFHIKYPDSSYRLTITHTDNYDCKGDWPSGEPADVLTSLTQQAQRDSVEFVAISGERKDIHGITFEILAYRTHLLPRQKYLSTLLTAVTVMDGVDITIEYECASKTCNDFVIAMKRSLSTIRISKK